jgi:hypothetical protein
MAAKLLLHSKAMYAVTVFLMEAAGCPECE